MPRAGRDRGRIGEWFPCWMEKVLSHVGLPFCRARATSMGQEIAIHGAFGCVDSPSSIYLSIDTANHVPGGEEVVQ